MFKLCYNNVYMFGEAVAMGFKVKAKESERTQTSDSLNELKSLLNQGKYDPTAEFEKTLKIEHKNNESKV